MGKNTDKLYITHSEWASSDAFSASAGSGERKGTIGATFRRLPYNFCALSLQPFSIPFCTQAGTIFDLTNILPWLKKHGTNPVDGQPLKRADLIKLNFAKNEEGEYVDQVTFKQFTDNTHIVALRNTGNVFAYETIERLNIKAKNWHDLVNDEEFSRKDIITLQDPTNLESRDLSSFKYIKEGTSTLTDEQLRERADPTSNLNLAAMGSSSKILKAKEAVAKARAERNDPNRSASIKSLATTNGAKRPLASSTKPQPYNAAVHTTGLAAAAFTSTGVSVHTSADRAILTDEEYMLKPRRVKQKGYIRMSTSQGDLAIELNTEMAPRAVWNFIQLAKKGYYKGVSFHRNIRNFMLQGGDPTGTGRGGQSIWGTPFVDEYATSGLTHNTRGVLSMANKGKNTNTSQFFICYRPAAHLDRKHTIFGKVIEEDVESMETLRKLEDVKTGEGDKPLEECMIEDILVFVDPFEEFQKEKGNQDEREKEAEEVKRQGGTEDDLTTWTGKKIRKDGKVENGDNEVGVGKYLDVVKSAPVVEEDEIVEEWEAPTKEEPPAKKRKAGGFGNFDAW
jgi:peptidyl-prolyl cis-trans isomerase-like protein 2